MKSFIKKCIPQGFKQKIKRILLGYQNFFPSFSHAGEDMLLRHIFSNKRNGFYIDIGSYDPVVHSNTYYFYQNGWNGINIDARPDSKKLFDLKRPKDINLEVAVSDKKELLDYYIFLPEQQSMNGFDSSFLKKMRSYQSYKEKIKIEAYPLTNILESHLTKDTDIDFLSLDVEGMELKVLKSNNWMKFRPKVIMVESFEVFNQDIFTSDLSIFMGQQKYHIIAKTINELVFLRDDCKQSAIGRIL